MLYVWYIWYIGRAASRPPGRAQPGPASWLGLRSPHQYASQSTRIRNLLRVMQANSPQMMAPTEKKFTWKCFEGICCKLTSS